MDVKHINPFLDAFISIMPQLGLADVKKKGITLKGRFIESPGVMIIVGIMGDMRGNVIYGTTIDNAKKIASTMMMGMPVDTFDEMAKSAVSELANMISGNAMSRFINSPPISRIV